MTTLRVLPNPWSAIDKDGHPCGVCPRDPDADAGGPGQYVGARVDPKRTAVLQDFGKLAIHELRSPMQRTKYSYLGTASDDPELATKLIAAAPIEIPRTKYYCDRIREGVLLCADIETARVAKVAGFLPLAQALASRLPKEAPVATIVAPEPADLAPTRLISDAPADADSRGKKSRRSNSDTEGAL